MITVAQALEHVYAHQKDFGVESVGLLQARGRVLATEVVADRDFPPFHRVMMDGIAISAKAFEEGRRTFRIGQVQPAGHAPQPLEDATACVEVMTGSCLPPGTDLIIPYEDCTVTEGVATVHPGSVRQRQHIHLQAADGSTGDVLLSAGTRITAAMIGTMATVGMDKVTVRRLPRTAVCSTGDELVPITAQPLPHQIRRSNSYMLAAALAEAGIAADLFHLPDDRVTMHRQLAGMLGQYDVILFSGAVSKGKYDFLPAVLEDLGMRKVFHRVAQKPGKPLLFGTFREGPVVFGLPGNPVSTMVCYKIFFQPWLQACLQCKGEVYEAQLTDEVEFSPALSYHLLVRLQTVRGVLLATPCSRGNSGDMPALQRADAILSLPPDRSIFSPGEDYPLSFLAPIG